MSILPGFVGPAYVATSPNAAVETLYNWYPQTVEAPEQKVQHVFYPRPGLVPFVSLPTGPVRALFAQDGLILAVGGQQLYQITGGGVATLRGTLTSQDSQIVRMVSSGTAGHQVFIVSGGNGDIYDTTSQTLTRIQAGGFPPLATDAEYLDTYFLTVKGGTAQFNISDLLDGTNWSGLDFAVVTQASDNLVGLIQNNKLIYMMGSRTTAPYYDSGNASFPFELVPQTLIPYGCGAKNSIVRANGGVGFLHQSERGRGIFLDMQGTGVQRVSTYAVEAIWAGYPTLSDAVSYALTWQGHDFCVLTFPSGNATFVYDYSERAWSQWSFWDAASATHQRFRGWVHCESGGLHFVGDWENGTIYTLDASVSTDNLEPIIWERTAPHICNQQLYNFYSDFQVDMETGLGGSTPTARLNWSDDGGHVFGNAIDLTTGTLGAYRTRARAAGNLGRSRDRNFRLRVSNDTPPRLLQAYLTVQGGTS